MQRSARAAALTVVLTLAVAMLGGIVTPAHALPPGSANNFQPDATFTTTARQGQRLSDRPHPGQTAHLTTVASTDSVVVEWYECPAGHNTTIDPTSAGCTKIGEDTTPQTPAVTGADRAFELSVNLLFEGTRDIVAWVCTSSALRNISNCTQFSESAVVVDDSAGAGAGQTSAGEITAPSHGGTISSTGVTVTANTSLDVTSLYACFEITADAVTAPNGCELSPTMTASTLATHKEWTVTVVPPVATELEIAIIETGTGGDGNCGSGVDCQLDAIYVGSGTPTPTTVHAHNDEDTTLNNDAAPTTCEKANRRKTGQLLINTQDNVLGCVFDAFADPDGDGNKDPAHDMSTETTWEITGAGSTFSATTSTAIPDGSCDGTAHDHNADGLFEHCHFAGKSDTVGGVDLYEAVFVSTANGTATGTFCFDADEDTPTAANHGCGEAGTIKDTITKTVAANIVAKVHAHNDEDTTLNNDNAASLCQNANRRKTGTLATNTQDNILGCVFDQSADPDNDDNMDIARDMSTTATWEITGTAKPTFGPIAGATPDGVCDGTRHVHTGGLEHCHYSVKSDTVGGVDLYEAVFVPTVAGSVTATFCFDPDQGSGAAAGHGCADASTSLKDTITKTAVGAPPPAEARRIDCTPKSATNTPGTDHVIKCTVDDGLNAKVPNVTVAWSKNDSGGAASTFVNQGSNTDVNGEVTATIRSTTAGQTSVTGAMSAGSTECEEAAGAGQGGNDSGKPAGKCSDTVLKNWGQAGKCPGFENASGNQIVGTSASETLTGTSSNDIICGLGGNDVINGLEGNDTLLGGDGNDTIRGGTGDDVIYGQTGNDILFGNEGADRVSGGDGADRINLGAGNDRGWGGGGQDRIWGLAGNDIIYGNTDDDPNLRGGAGNDFIVGGSGSDGIVGEAGNDKGYGQSGNDRLYFREGARDARVDGGGGSDLCSFDRGLDVVVNCP